MKSALVLGGGGVIGVAWESGILAGLRDGGITWEGLDVIVGTSAGAIVGSQLAAERVASVPLAEATEDGGDTVQLIDPARLDRAALAEIFALWTQMEGPTPEIAARIGKRARGLNRDAEQWWIDSAAEATGLADWPKRRLLVCVVDAESGARRIFDRESGVDVVRAIAASSAVPGLFPCVEIDGVPYMDGQVHSSTNADVLLSDPPEQVFIAMPTTKWNAQGLGVHAERAVAHEIRALEAAGCRVSLRSPDAADAAKMGANLMDPRGAPAAYACGRATGLAWADEF